MDGGTIAPTRSAALLVAAAGVMFASATAVAQTRDDAPRVGRVAPIDASASLLAGVWANGGFILGGTALARIGHFDVGAEGVSGTGVWDHKYVGCAFDAGFAWQIARG